mgnify:CR=1 FL=1
MAKRVRIEFISRGFHDLLSSSEVAGVVMDAAADIADVATGLSAAIIHHKDAPAYEVKGPKEGGYGGGRQIAYVAAANGAAYGDAVRHQVLERAVNASRIH